VHEIECAGRQSSFVDHFGEQDPSSRCFHIDPVAGEVVFGDGEPSDELYFLLSGRVSIVHGAARPEAFRIVTLLPGNILGNVAFADSLPRTASAICDEPSDLVRLRRSALEALGRDHPELVTRVYVELAADIASRLRATDELVRERA